MGPDRDPRHVSSASRGLKIAFQTQGATCPLSDRPSAKHVHVHAAWPYRPRARRPSASSPWPGATQRIRAPGRMRKTKRHRIAHATIGSSKRATCSVAS
eukprot:1585083-Prymnesium_polylepis.1